MGVLRSHPSRNSNGSPRTRSSPRPHWTTSTAPSPARTRVRPVARVDEVCVRSSGRPGSRRRCPSARRSPGRRPGSSFVVAGRSRSACPRTACPIRPPPKITSCRARPASWLRPCVSRQAILPPPAAEALDIGPDAVPLATLAVVPVPAEVRTHRTAAARRSRPDRDAGKQRVVRAARHRASRRFRWRCRPRRRCLSPRRPTSSRRPGLPRGGRCRARPPGRRCPRLPGVAAQVRRASSEAGAIALVAKADDRAGETPLPVRASHHAPDLLSSSASASPARSVPSPRS